MYMTANPQTFSCTVIGDRLQHGIVLTLSMFHSRTLIFHTLLGKYHFACLFLSFCLHNYTCLSIINKAKR